MDRLEVKDIKFSEISLDNEKFRIDDEFFLKKYLSAYKNVKSKSHVQLGNEISALTDFHANGSYENIARNFQLLDDKDYAYMVRSTDLELNNFEDNIKYITKNAYNFLSKTKLYGGEILINKIGSPGRVYLMPQLNVPVSLGMNLFMLRLQETSVLNSNFVWVYFNTEYGQNIIKRKINGTVPLTIDKEAVRSLYVPVFSKRFQEKIAKLSNDYELLISKSKLFYKESEDILLIHLGLDNYKPNTDGISVKSFSESFSTTGRLDSEYYQPKYDELNNAIDNFDNDILGNIVNIKKSVEPGSSEYLEEGIPFVRVSDLSKFEICEPKICLNGDTFGNNDLQPKKDTVLLSKDGSVGIAYKVEKNLDIVTSGAILHLSIKKDKKVLPDYLTLVLNSVVVQLQAERDAGGSIIQHWKPSEIANVRIPILDEEIQKEISEKVQESFILRKKSAEFLTFAKTAVEMAIEQGEDMAMKWLEGKVYAE